MPAATDMGDPVLAQDGTESGSAGRCGCHVVDSQVNGSLADELVVGVAGEQSGVGAVGEYQVVGAVGESPRHVRRLRLLREDEVCEFEEVSAGVA